MSNLDPVELSAFKAGYSYQAWDTFNMGYASRDKIKREGDRMVIPLRKLTMAERRRGETPSVPHEAFLDKVILMLKEINKNEIDLGREPISIWKGEAL